MAPDELLTHHASGSRRALSRNSPGRPSAPCERRRAGAKAFHECVTVKNTVRHRRRFGHRVAAVRVRQDGHLPYVLRAVATCGTGRACADVRFDPGRSRPALRHAIELGRKVSGQSTRTSRRRR